MLLRPGAYLALAVLLIGGTGTAHGQSSPPESSERQAIESLWLALDSAWNARDAQRFSSFFADDVSFEFVDRRQSLDGRAAVYRHFDERFPSLAADVRHRTTIRDVRVFNKAIYVVDGTVDILRHGAREAEAPPSRSFSITAVMGLVDGTLTIHMLRIYQLTSGAASEQSPDHS